MKKKVLVVAAHPDDEILGVGGTLLKHKSEGDEIYICIVTKAYEPQWTKEDMKLKLIEQKKVDEFIGVKKRFNLDFPTVKLNTVPAGEINQKIIEVVEEVKPEIIYTHFEYDLNYDHTVVFRGCMVAARPPKNIALRCFETLSETEWNNKAFKPNFWVDIKNFIDDKVKLFKIYSKEVKKYPHPRSPKGIHIQANYRGIEVCKEFVEAFIVVKDWWN